MTVELSDEFIRALKESDSTILLGGCTTGTIEPEFYYIWDKEYSTLYLSISFSNNDNYEGNIIYCYFRRKHDSVKDFNEKAITLSRNNASINKLIEIDLSNIDVESEIESSLPERLELVEDFNLDIGSSIFLENKEDNKKLITKRSFTKLLYLTKTIDFSTDFYFGKTILNQNGETIYRKFKYRNYKKDQFFPKLLNSKFITKEDNLDCYNVGNNRAVLKLSGKIGYTDLIIENNKIIEKIDGYQNINEILNINISKKYKDSKIIWEDNILVDRSYNIIVPENKTDKPRKETLTLSINFVDNDNNLITLSQDIKINQTKEYNNIKPWNINYGDFQNIRVEYETSDENNIPVVIFQEPILRDEYLDLTSSIYLKCHPDMLEQLSNKEIIVGYEYLSDEYNNDKDAKSVFSEFFKIEKQDLNLETGEIILNITANSILKDGWVILSDKLWYPYVIDKPVVIKYTLSVDLEGFMGLNNYKEEIIFIRQPENIHKYGSISVTPKEIDITDFNPYGLSEGEINLTYNIDKNIIGNISDEEYTKYCGWILDKIIPIDPIDNSEIALNKYGKFTGSEVIGSIPILKFYYNNYSDYLFRSENVEKVINGKICDVIINGLSNYYFKEVNDNDFFNIYSRLFENGYSIPWQKKVFMTSIKKTITCGINSNFYIEDNSGNFNKTNTISLNDIGIWNYIHICNIFPIKVINDNTDIKLVNIETDQEVVRDEYYSGKSIFKITRKYLTTENNNKKFSITINNSSTNYEISLARPEYSDLPNLDDVIFNKDCFRLINNEEDPNHIGILINKSLKVYSNDDIVINSNNLHKIELNHYRTEGEYTYLNPTYDNKFEYVNHSIDFKAVNESDIVKTRCPIQSDLMYFSTVLVNRINNTENKSSEVIYPLRIVNIDQFISPKFYDKLGNEFTNMDLLMFDNPRGYSLSESEKNKFYVLSEYPLTNNGFSINLDPENSTIWKESIGGFYLSSEDYINLEDSLINNNEESYIESTTCDKSNFKNSEYNNILNYFTINDSTTNSSTEIKNSVCRNNIFCDYRINDNFSLDYDSIENRPIEDVIPSAKAVINTYYCGDINNNIPEKNEYVEYNNKKYYIEASSKFIKLDTIAENSLDIQFHKWFQSDIEKILCIGNVCSGLGENSVISYYHNDNNHDNTKIDIYKTNSGKELAPADTRISTGGYLSGISKIPINIHLEHKYYDEIKEDDNNIINLDGKNIFLGESNDIGIISKHLYSTNYNIEINLNNRLLKNKNNETYIYKKNISIPWKGLDNAFLTEINDSTGILFEKEGCLNINLGQCNWDTTTVSFKILPVSMVIIGDRNDLSDNSFFQDQDSPNQYKIKLTRDLNYYNRLKSIYPVDSGNYSIINNNLPQLINDTEYNVSDISFDIMLNFPQNTTNRPIDREFRLLLDNDLIIPIKITQHNISGENLISIVDKDKNIRDQILLHSSGYCINDVSEIGTLRLKSSTSNIYNYSEKNVNMYFQKSGSEELIFITNQADITETTEKTERKTYYLTISANFPTRYTKGESANVGTLIITDNNGNHLKAFNCKQGYTYPKLIDDNNREFLVDLENSEYIGRVGSKDEPVLYNLSGKIPSYRIAFYQRELIYNNSAQSFGFNLEINERKVTMGERISSSADYSSITYLNSIWFLFGKSKFILKDNYKTDLEYLDNNLRNINIFESYPTLIHNFEIDENTNYLINSSEDLINIKLSLCISNHLLTAAMGVANNSVPSSDLISNSPIIYDFWIRYCN